MASNLQINRYDRLVRRLMNLVGESAIVTTVLPDVFPTIDVEDLQTDGWGVAGWKPALGGARITAAAGQRPHIQINNPAGSGVITVVESVIFGTNTSNRVEFNVHDALLTTLTVANRWRDRRFPTLSRPITQVRQQSIVGTPIVSPILAANLVAFTTQIWQQPKGVFVLVPGTGFAFSHPATAIELSVSFFWRERPIEPAESNI